MVEHRPSRSAVGVRILTPAPGFKMLIKILFCLIIISTPCYGIDTYTSPDSKWLAVRAFYKDINPTIGIDATDIKIHKFHITVYLSNKIIEDKIVYQNSYREMLSYKKSNTITPNFAVIKCFIYIDDNPVAVYEFHTQGTGIIMFSFFRWLY
jgi:hypothetical protein